MALGTTVLVWRKRGATTLPATATTATSAKAKGNIASYLSPFPGEAMSPKQDDGIPHQLIGKIRYPVETEMHLCALPQ